MALNPLLPDEKRVVLISGGGKGFGKSLVISYLEKGWNVATFSRSKSDLTHLKNLAVQKYENNLLVENFDGRQSKQLSSFVEGVFQKWSRIDVLINNAGVRFRREFLCIEEQDFKDVLDINLIVPALLSQLVIQKMIEQNFGNIINISSILGITALENLSAYQMSKFGLNGLTKSIAIEFCKQGINCNSIAPGFCKTSYFEKFEQNTFLMETVSQKIPMGRWGEEHEINGLCHFLSDEKSNYINGMILPIDGGWTI